MKRLTILSTFLSVVSLSTAFAQNGSFIDHGFIPAPLSIYDEYPSGEFQTMIYQDNHVFVATSDGIWKNNLTFKEWSRSGLDSKVVNAIYQHPSIPDKFFASITPHDRNSGEKTIFISNDNGNTWNASEPLYDSSSKAYELYYSFAVHPDNPDYIFANVSGPNITISKDGGLTWHQMNYNAPGLFGYASTLTFIPNNPHHLFQGSENPLDDAWLGRYSVREDDPVYLDSFILIVSNEKWGNRRPCKLSTFNHTGNSIYVGQEGALTKVNDTNTHSIYWSENAGDKHYTYVYAIWVDPLDTQHIIFGGGINDDTQSMQLFETYDEGKTIHRFTEKYEIENPVVLEIVETNTFPAIIINDRNANKVKLLLYNPKPVSLENPLNSGMQVTIAPNPANEKINIIYNHLPAFQQINLVVTNNLGQIVFQQSSKQAITTVDMHSFSSGVYYISIDIDGTSLTKKVIKN